jgi:hypothetical protein
MLCLSYYFLCFLLNKIGEQEGRTSYAWKQGWGVGEVAQTMCTHVIVKMINFTKSIFQIISYKVDKSQLVNKVHNLLTIP